jgi:dihydrofolate synthase/folylpolyglutamate synthase
MSTTYTYAGALRFIYSLTDYEKKGFAAYAPENYDLRRMNRLLVLLGNPQQQFSAVHIAGTKGKGSTAAMVDAVLRVAGQRTGLYTSPHLHTFRERIQVSGEMIPESEVCRLLALFRPLIEQVDGITTFEVMTGMAFAYFALEMIDWAVLEVGLGGRLDATNVVTPTVSVITSISRDHTAVLGDTLAEIAAEKAGIIKPGVPVVSAPQSPEALAVIQAKCEENDAPLTLVGRDWSWTASPESGPGQHFHVSNSQNALDDLWLPLLGQPQLENATTAIAALDVLRKTGVALSDGQIRDGLARVRWPGRLETVLDVPHVVVDSAHNGDSARKLIASLSASFEFERLVIIVGASGDHLTPALLDALMSAAGRSIATQASHPRAATPELVQRRASEVGYDMQLSDSVPHAVDLALASAQPGDLICCTGSVFVAAEARQYCNALRSQPDFPKDPF